MIILMMILTMMDDSFIQHTVYSLLDRYLANMNLKSENLMRNMNLVEIRRILYQGSSDRPDILIYNILSNKCVRKG
jgi:hypothetical protein